MKKRTIGTFMCIAGTAAFIISGVGAEVVLASSLDTQSDTETQEAEVEEDRESVVSPVFEGPYDVESLDGQKAVGYEVINNTEDNIYVGLMAEFMSETDENIGMSSAFVPCIAPGESAYIFAVDNYGEKSGNYVAVPFWGTSDYAAATDALSELSVTEDADSLSFSAENTSSEAVYLPQITVEYQLDSEPIAVYTGMLSDGSGETYLSASSEGTVTISCPDEYDDYIYWVTAVYDIPVYMEENEPLGNELTDTEGEDDDYGDFVDLIERMVSLDNFPNITIMVDFIENEGLYGCGIETGNSKFDFICDPSGNGGKITIMITPEYLDANSGTDDYIKVAAALIQAIDGTDSAMGALSAYNVAMTTFTEESFLAENYECAYVPDAGVFAISY